MMFLWFNSNTMLVTCYLYLFVYTGVQCDFHIRWCSCHSTVTRRMSLVEQELPTLPEHPSSSPVLSGIHVALSLVFFVMFCKSLFVVFVWPLYELSYAFWLPLLVSLHFSSYMLKFISDWCFIEWCFMFSHRVVSNGLMLSYSLV